MGTHCDDLIDDPAQPKCLRDFLGYRRAPAIKQVLGEDREPVLFATLNRNVHGESYLGYWKGDKPAMKPVEMKAGQRVRIVMASRFGDVGITPDIDASRGYVARLFLDDLSEFSSTQSSGQEG